MAVFSKKHKGQFFLERPQLCRFEGGQFGVTHLGSNLHFWVARSSGRGKKMIILLLMTNCCCVQFFKNTIFLLEKIQTETITETVRCRRIQGLFCFICFPIKNTCFWKIGHTFWTLLIQGIWTCPKTRFSNIWQKHHCHTHCRHQTGRVTTLNNCNCWKKISVWS